jgi:hypothetical protein
MELGYVFLGINSPASALGAREIKDTLGRVGWSQDLPGALSHLTSSPAGIKYANPNVTPYP